MATAPASYAESPQLSSYRARATLDLRGSALGLSFSQTGWTPESPLDEPMESPLKELVHPHWRRHGNRTTGANRFGPPFSGQTLRNRVCGTGIDMLIPLLLLGAERDQQDRLGSPLQLAKGGGRPWLETNVPKPFSRDLLESALKGRSSDQSRSSKIWNLQCSDFRPCSDQPFFQHSCPASARMKPSP